MLFDSKDLRTSLCVTAALGPPLAPGRFAVDPFHPERAGAA